ncbi:MAG: hypothetical protein ACLPY5_04625 [Candidatus Bathyarchaeia archaeon]
MPDNQLSELSGKILLSLWRLNGIGPRAIQEQILKADLKVESEQFFQETDVLTRQGFLDKSTLEGQTAFSLTSLGLAILRQLEEDKLQELG